MALVDVHGGGVRYLLGPAVHPRLVAPGVAGVQVVNFRGDIRPGGGVEGEGVGLAHIGAVGLEDGILIGIVALEAGDEDLPDAALDLLHGGGLEVPVVEVTDEGDLGGIGGPDPEEIALGPVLCFGGVGAEAAPGMGGVAVGKGLEL